MFFYNEGDSEVSQIQAPSIVTEGLQLHLDAGDTNSYPGTGTTWYDLSGNGNNATLVNGLTYSTNDGGSLTLDGTADYMTIDSVSANIGNFTFEIIAKWSTLSDVFSLGNGSVPSGGTTVQCFIAENGITFAQYRPGGWITGNKISGTFLNNTVYKISVVHSGNLWSVYSNGVFLGSYQFSFSPDETYVSTVFAPLRYAVQFSNNSKNSPSTVYHQTIYNRALSEAEVLQNFNATKTRFGL